MYPCTVSQLTEIIGCASADERIRQDRITGGSIDSRTVKPGEVFFAVPGSSVHGILFADDAIARGAACVVTDFRTCPASHDPDRSIASLHSPESAETDRRVIHVASASDALQSLARWNRRQSACLMIGVTGSVGKTTTRQMIALVLGAHYAGIQSPHNFNNELGVPLSLLALASDHDFAVLELAAARPGDIRLLAGIVEPEFAVVTRVAPAHLDSFRDMETIRRTKQELVEAVSRTGTVFLNADDPAVRSMSGSAAADVILFGTSRDSAIRAVDLTAQNGACSFTVDTQRFDLRGGRQLVTAALAAVAVGRIVGIADSQIAERLSGFQPDAGRGRVVLQWPWTVIDDTYNASPASVLAAIELLEDWSAGRRILVLGDMLELGSDAEQLHEEIGRAIAESGIDHAILFGRYADAIVSGARSAGARMNRVSCFSSLATMQSILACLATPGDVLLVKGSRGMQMERVVNWLLEQGRGNGSTRFAA